MGSIVWLSDTAIETTVFRILEGNIGAIRGVKGVDTKERSTGPRQGMQHEGQVFQ